MANRARLLAVTAFALSLVLAAGFVHAGWNYLAKRSGGGLVFIWLFTLVSAVVYAPLAVFIWIWLQPSIGLPQLACICCVILIHASYFLLLQRGYRAGDFSLVYPLARGSGPALAMVAAILFFHERPSVIAILGGVLVASGVFLLAGASPRARVNRKRAVGYGLLTGASIAIYTLVDKLAVSTLLIPPVLLVFTADLGRVLLLCPLAMRRWGEVCREWNLHRREILAVGALCPLPYILVLTALVTTPVSYIAPAREVSILIGAVMGSRWLSEGDSRRRIPAAAAIVMGLVALAIG